MDNANDGGALRKQLEKTLADNKALAEKLAAFEAKERTATVAESLKSKGLNPKLAKFVSPEDAADPSRLDAWIKDNADLFGTAQNAPEVTEPPAASSVPADAQAAFTQIQRVTENGSHAVTDLSAIQAQMRAAKDPAEFDALMRQYRMG